MEPGSSAAPSCSPTTTSGTSTSAGSSWPTGCGPFTETDVVINAGFGSGWTPRLVQPGNDQRGGLAMVQATVLHEVGHTPGLHHIFKLPATNANSFSVMNYANDDAARWVTRIDSKTVRTEYPSRSGSLLDVATTRSSTATTSTPRSTRRSRRAPCRRERRSRSTGCSRTSGTRPPRTSKSLSTPGRRAAAAVPAARRRRPHDTATVGPRPRRRRQGLLRSPLRPPRHGRRRVLGRRDRHRERRARTRPGSPGSPRRTASSWDTAPGRS